MSRSVRKASFRDSPLSPSHLVATFFCLRSKASTTDNRTPANTGTQLRPLPYRHAGNPNHGSPYGDFGTDGDSDTESTASNPRPNNNYAATTISYALPPLPKAEIPTLIPPKRSTSVPSPAPATTTSWPQFYILLSGSFSALGTLFARRLFSHTSGGHLSPAVQEMLEEAIDLQLTSLMDRKLAESEQFAAHTGETVDQEYRVSFFIGTLQGMGESRHYVGQMPKLLAAEEAREIVASLETIIARQIAIFDPPEQSVGQGAGIGRFVDILDTRPLNLTLRFDICDSGQKILATRFVACETPTYPLPPPDEVRALMQRIWKSTYTLVRRERLSNRDSAALSPSQKEKVGPWRFAVSFEVLFGDAEYRWFGGLCYGWREREFSEETLERLVGKVERVGREQLAIFEVLGRMGWPEREGGRDEGGFVTTDGLEDVDVDMEREGAGKESKRGVREKVSWMKTLSPKKPPKKERSSWGSYR